MKMLFGPGRCLYLIIIAGALALLTRPAGAQIDIFIFNDHTYYLYGSADAQTWPTAVNFASGLNVGGQPGYLARIDDAAENARIFQSVNDNQGSLTNVSPDGGDGRYVWIGANDRATEGSWLWQDNSAVFWNGGPNGAAAGGLYNNWASLGGFGQTEPDNFPANPDGQDAAGMSVNGYPLGSAGQWNDISDQNIMPFVVEFNVPEPAGISLVALGGVMLLRRRRSHHRG